MPDTFAAVQPAADAESAAFSAQDPHEAERSLLDQLIADSRLYHSSADYLRLLRFVARLRNFAPFNAMLLHIQKPGLRYAASAADWRDRYGRTPKPKARPLLILWPFGPVALVYDVQDTVGDPLPEGVAAFVASGPVDDAKIADCRQRLHKNLIVCVDFDGGDADAGSIEVVQRGKKDGEPTRYRLHLNRNHLPPVQFATLAHELAHLFLGHLGDDRPRRVCSRRPLAHAQRELEAESVAYLVCRRHGVRSKSHTYLADHVGRNTRLASLDLYPVMRAAGQVETLMGLASQMHFERGLRGRERDECRLTQASGSTPRPTSSAFSSPGT